MAEPPLTGKKVATWGAEGCAKRSPTSITSSIEFRLRAYAPGIQPCVFAPHVPQFFPAERGAPLLAPVEGDLESLLHAAGKPYFFVDFRSLPQDHWLRQPLAPRSIRVTASGIASQPLFYGGLLSIDLAALKDKKKK
jgi:hypothetical protein